MYATEPSHVVMSDVDMPGLSGLEVVSQIRANDPQARALYMSGYTPEIVTGHGVPDDGRVVRKPFDSTTLLQAVRECLNGKSGFLTSR